MIVFTIRYSVLHPYYITNPAHELYDNQIPIVDPYSLYSGCFGPFNLSVLADDS